MVDRVALGFFDLTALPVSAINSFASPGFFFRFLAGFSAELEEVFPIIFGSFT